MTRPPLRTRTFRTGFGVVWLVVVMGFGLVVFLLLAQLKGSESVASERRLALSGTVAETACQNALTEATWSLVTRANSPRLSEREAQKGNGPDLYPLLRGPAMAEPVAFPFRPAISRRLMANRRVVLGGVEVRLQLLRTRPARVTTLATSPLAWPAPIDPAGLALVPPAGWLAGPGQALPSRGCNLRVVRFDPQLVGEGVMELAVEARAGQKAAASRRKQTVRKSFSVWQMDAAGTLKLVRVAPFALVRDLERNGGAP